MGNICTFYKKGSSSGKIYRELRNQVLELESLEDKEWVDSLKKILEEYDTLLNKILGETFSRLQANVIELQGNLLRIQENTSRFEELRVRLAKEDENSNFLGKYYKTRVSNGLAEAEENFNSVRSSISDIFEEHFSLAESDHRNLGINSTSVE